jgi:hypothetical protein
MREELAEGRPKNRWRKEVINELKKLKLRNWSQSAKKEMPEMIWCRRPKPMQGCSFRKRKDILKKILCQVPEDGKILAPKHVART